ncbi:MAG: heme exporter protein CcmD [Proteobacteria bacterium]|nr:heme exporter protein CcmD [Pseudomonadota bacterium]
MTYGIYIWAAWGMASVVVAAITIASLYQLRASKRRLAVLRGESHATSKP